MTLRLSIIVPFYNVEPYIEECIRSLYAQDIPWEEYEVICVDDCSPDNSRAIVKRLQLEFPTLQLLTHIQNKRQGGARNTAIQIAQGRYVWFVDSDDYIGKNCLKNLLEVAEKDDVDLLKFYYQKMGSIPFPKMINYGPCSGSDLVFDAPMNIPSLERCSSVCMQLIKNKLLKDYAISFAEGVQYEDDDVAYQIYAFASRVLLVPLCPYIVRVVPNSTTRRSNDLRRVVDIYLQAKRMVELISTLSSIDSRWYSLIKEGIRDSFERQIFPMLKDCSFINQLHFWILDTKRSECFRGHIGYKSYLKLRSYLAWKILQR